MKMKREKEREETSNEKTKRKIAEKNLIEPESGIYTTTTTTTKRSTTKHNKAFIAVGCFGQN